MVLIFTDAGGKRRRVSAALLGRKVVHYFGCNGASSAVSTVAVVDAFCRGELRRSAPAPLRGGAWS